MDADGTFPMHLPPRELAESLLSRAWDDDVADGERLLLEQAALAIQGLLVQVAAANERHEASRGAR